MDHPMRRAERAVSVSEARQLLEQGEYGILSTCGPDGQPYGLPLNYCVLNNAIYFHCALDGRKLVNLAAEFLYRAFKHLFLAVTVPENTDKLRTLYIPERLRCKR